MLCTLATLAFLPNGFAQLEVPFANIPFDTTKVPEPVPPPVAVRDFFELDPYYQQWINVRGFPVLASAEVRPYALKEAAWVIWQMIGHRPDALRTMAGKKARFVIVPHNKHTSDMPESNTGRLSFFWDVRHRAVHCRGCPIASNTEEAFIGKYALPIHEFGHMLQDWWLGWDGSNTLNNRVIALYNMAKAEGLYQGYYAGSTVAEYWAEGVASWFNGANPKRNVAPTRSAFKKYDPRFANLLTEVFGDGDWRYTRPATRTHLPHLRGFDPQEAPIYQRPARLLKIEAQLRDPNSDGDGKWVNLKQHDPSELPRLLNSAARNESTRTEFIYGNLTGTDLTLYSFNADGRKTLRYYSTSDDFTALDTHVGAIWLIEDHTGKDVAVFRAEEEVGRVLIGGPPSQDVLDVNGDGDVDIQDLTPIASRYGRRVKNPADVNEDGIVNVVDILLVVGSVSALSRQAVETLKATEVQKWLTDAKQLDIADEYQQKGIVILEHLLAEIALLSAPRAAAGQSAAVFPGHTDIVWSVAFSPDGQTLASSGWDDKIRLWNTETKQHEITLIEQVDIMAVAFSPDGQTLASGNWNAVVRLWDPSTGEIKRTLVGHTDGVESVAFSPDGATLASSSADRTIRLWDPSTGELKRTLTGQGRMRSVAFSPDGRLLASGSSDHTIQLWNPDTGKLIRTLVGHTDWVEGLAFSPDGNTLASGGGGSERMLRLWNPHNGQEIRKFTGYTDQVSGVAFSPDGRLLASGSWGRNVRLWNTETGKDEKALEGHKDSVLTVVFGPDGTTLASGGPDGTVRLWELIPDDTTPDKITEDVNSDGSLNVLDLILISINFGKTGQNPADVNGDGIVNIVDLVKVAGEIGGGAAAPAAHPQTLEMLTAADVKQWITQAQHENLTDATSQRGILTLQHLLAALIPKETSLLLNYPNPFNPETWIPYRLAKSADVTLSIYAVDGRLIRTLTLGHQPVGMYQRKSRAAYWDGRNKVGEPVASGVYFYTLTAGDFTATRKMLIRK